MRAARNGDAAVNPATQYVAPLVEELADLGIGFNPHTVRLRKNGKVRLIGVSVCRLMGWKVRAAYRRRGGGYVNDTKSNQAGTEIHFDADLLIKALRYHLAETGMVEQDVLETLPAGGISARVSRETWANFDDDQRLCWLLDTTRRVGGGKRAKTLGIGARFRGAKQN